jgi:hypothetical protein
MPGRPYHDRTEAGRYLAQRLAGYAGRPDVLVLALPCGGVPVAYEVARALGAPLDVFFLLPRQQTVRDRPRGNYCTYPSSQQTALAIPHNQETAHVDNVEFPVEALKTTVADASVDWTRSRAVNPAAPEYRHGGGLRRFIWDANHHLKHL